MNEWDSLMATIDAMVAKMAPFLEALARLHEENARYEAEALAALEDDFYSGRANS